MAETFYGHTFRINDEGMKVLDKPMYNFRHRGLRGLGRKMRRSIRDIRKRKKRDSEKLLDEFALHSKLIQKNHFARYYVGPDHKTSQEGIFNSIRKEYVSTHEVRVGQRKFYTKYLINGNVGNFGSNVIVPTNHLFLKLKLPNGSRAYARRVHTIDPINRYDFVGQSFNELKPWMKQRSRYILAQPVYGN